MKNLIIILILALFFVQCGKKKDNGLGLGILLLAGGGDSSSSSSDNATNSVTPKPGGGNGGDDPNNAPEFDEVKQEIEKNIKFPAGNENKILSSNSDYQSVDFSITGDFFQELGKLEKLSLEHSVSAGSKKTNPTKIDITKQFLTDKKIPLSLDISPIQPDIGLARPKLKLKFSSNDKQIIQKEWTQKMILKGKSVLSFKDENDNNLTEGVVYNSSKTVKIEAENIEPSIQVRIESELKDVSASDANITSSFTPINLPSKDQTKLTESTESLAAPTAEDLGGFKAYLIKVRTFVRLKESETWKPLTDTLYRSYSIDEAQNPDKLKIETNKTLLNTGDDLVITIKKAIPSDNIGFFIREIIPGPRRVSDDKTKIINIVSTLGKIQARKDNNSLANQNVLPVDWKGRHYWSNFSKTNSPVQKDYQFTLKGFKDRSFSLMVTLAPSDLMIDRSTVVVKILGRP